MTWHETLGSAFRAHLHALKNSNEYHMDGAHKVLLVVKGLFTMSEEFLSHQDSNQHAQAHMSVLAENVRWAVDGENRSRYGRRENIDLGN